MQMQFLHGMMMISRFQGIGMRSLGNVKSDPICELAPKSNPTPELKSKSNPKFGFKLWERGSGSEWGCGWSWGCCGCKRGCRYVSDCRCWGCCIGVPVNNEYTVGTTTWGIVIVVIGLVSVPSLWSDAGSDMTLLVANAHRRLCRFRFDATLNRRPHKSHSCAVRRDKRMSKCENKGDI